VRRPLIGKPIDQTISIKFSTTVATDFC